MMEGCDIAVSVILYLKSMTQCMHGGSAEPARPDNFEITSSLQVTFRNVRNRLQHATKLVRCGLLFSAFLVRGQGVSVDLRNSLHKKSRVSTSSPSDIVELIFLSLSLEPAFRRRSPLSAGPAGR